MVKSLMSYPALQAPQALYLNQRKMFDAHR